MKTKQFIWSLTANGCGTLGCPMGTEHIGPRMWTRIFKTEKDAKDHAEKVANEGSLTWYRSSPKLQRVDARWVLFDLEKSEVL